MIITSTIKSSEAFNRIKFNARYAKLADGYAFSRSPSQIKWILMTNESIKPQVLPSTMIFSDSEFEENSVCSETSNTENVDEETIRSLSDDYISKFNFVYPYDKVRKIPAKLSVSRLYPSLLDEYDTAFDTETVTNAKIRTPQFMKSSGRSGCHVR